MSLCSRGSRESLCSEILVFVEVHQHHETGFCCPCTPSPCSSLQPSLKSSQIPKYPGVTPQKPFTSLNPYFWGHQGHHITSSSAAFPTWHPGLGSPLLMSGEDFARVFPLSHNFLLLLISELIFTVLGRVWAHLLLLTGQFSACQVWDAVRAAAYSRGKVLRET